MQWWRVLQWLGGESSFVGFVCVCFFPGTVKREVKLNGGCCCRLELIQKTTVVLKIPLNVLIQYFLGVENPRFKAHCFIRLPSPFVFLFCSWWK